MSTTHTVLPVTPAQVERIAHDHDLTGAEYRLWLFCCSHAREPDGAFTITVRDLQTGAGFRTITRALLALNALVEGGYIIVQERQWEQSRLKALVLSVAAKLNSASAAARRCAVFHQRV